MSAPIEFVLDDEPIEPSPPPAPKRPPRWWLRISAVAVLLAAGIAWVVTRPSESPAPHVAQRPVPSILDTEPVHRVRCSVGAPIDPDVLRAVNSYVSRTTVQQALSQQCVRTIGDEQRVVAEAMIVNAAGYNLRVSLSAPDEQYPPAGLRDRGITLGQIETESAGVRVQLVATGYPDSAAPMARLQKLADYLSLNTALPARAVAGNATGCRVVPDCTRRSGVPAAVEMAVLHAVGPPAHVHASTIVQVNSLTLDDQLVRRDLAVSAGSVTLHIRIERGRPSGRQLVDAPLGFGSAMLHSVVSGYSVRLQYVAPETLPPDLAPLRRLLHDQRLETL